MDDDQRLREAFKRMYRVAANQLSEADAKEIEALLDQANHSATLTDEDRTEIEEIRQAMIPRDPWAGDEDVEAMVRALEEEHK